MSKLNIINNNLQVIEMNSSVEQPRLISNDWKVLKTLSNISTDGNDTTVWAKCNASYFIMSGGEQGQIIGRNQGIKSNLSIVDDAPNQGSKPLYEMVVTTSQQMVTGLFGSGDYRGNQYIGCGVGAVLIKDGQKVYQPSEALGLNNSSKDRVYTYTLFGQLSNNNFIMVGCTNYSPSGVTDVLMNVYNIKQLVQLDGGGSTQLNLNGKIQFNPDGSQRPIPNAIAFIEGFDKPEPPEPPIPPTTDTYDYCIYPCKGVNISQREQGSFSHKGVNAIDNSQGGKAPVYAPFRCKLLAVNTPLNTANQVYYGSCDENGDPKAVYCADGKMRILTWAGQHDNDISEFVIGKIYNSGELIYHEGDMGFATGDHVHMQVGEGWVTNKYDIGNPSWVLENELKQSELYFLLSGWSEIMQPYGLNGYDFPYTDKRTHKGDTPEPPIPPTPGSCDIWKQEVKRLNGVVDGLMLTNTSLNQQLTQALIDKGDAEAKYIAVRKTLDEVVSIATATQNITNTI